MITLARLTEMISAAAHGRRYELETTREEDEFVDALLALMAHERWEAERDHSYD